MSAAPRVTSFSEDSLREWFSQYDQDGTGLMDETALGQLCEQLGLDACSAPDIMKELDTNRDGKITFDDVLSKFGSHIHGVEEQGDMSSVVEEGPSVTQDTQQFFTPQGKGVESRAGTEVPPGMTMEETAHSTPVRSSLIFKKQHYGRWSISGNTPSNVFRRAPTPEGEGEDREIQFLSPIPSSPPHSSRPGSSQDNYPDLTSMMSSFITHSSLHGHQRKGSQVSSDEENLWEDTGSIYSSAVAADTHGVPPKEAWSAQPGVSHLVSKDRSQSVPAPPTAQPRQSLLPFGGGHFGPLNGLRQLVSPRSSKEEDFAIPLEEVLEELEEAGVASEEGYSTERVLQELDLVSDGSVNLRNLAYSMDQFLATPVADKGPVSFVMRQIASKAYQNELQLLRNQISVLNIEKDTLQFNVSRMVEDKDKMATQVDTDHDEMDRRTAEMLMDKELKYKERVKEVEKSFQREMESMRESTKSTMLRLEADNSRLRDEEERMRDEIKHDRTEMERLHKELDQTRHELEAKEHQITSLLRETSSQLDVVHLLEENETLKLKIRELEKGGKWQQIAELEEQCKDFKDRNDMLQSDLEKTLEELKKYRRKAQILRKKEKQLRNEHQRLLEGGRTASGPSPDLVQQTSHSALPSSSSLEDEGEVAESEDVEEEFEDKEGVQQTSDNLSEGEEKSLHGELHDLELKAAKKKIAKLENTQIKLSRHVGQLQAECQALREKEESLKGKLEGKQQECEQFQIHLANLEGKLVSPNALKAELEVSLQRKGQALLEAQEALEKERERCSVMEEDHQRQLASLSDELTSKKCQYEELVNGLKSDLGNLGRENVVLESECSNLRKQVGELRGKLADHEQNFKEMKAKISDWVNESQIGRSQAEQNAAERLQQAMESLRQEQVLHSWTKESFAEEKHSLQSQLVAAQKKCEDLTTASAELQGKTDELMAEVSQLKEQLQFVSQDKEEAAEQHLAEVGRLKALVDAATILQSENDKLTQQLQSLSEQLTTEHRRLAEVQEEHSVEVQALQEEMDRVQGDLMAAKTHVEETQQRFAALEGEMDDLRQLKKDEVGELTARVAELEGQAEAQQSELSLSQQENVELERSLGELEASQEKHMHAMEASVSKLSARVEELEAELEVGRVRFEGVEEELKEATVERDLLQGELAELKDRMAAADVLHQKQLMDEQSSFAADLKSHRAELQREREHLEGQVTQANTALEEARSRLERAESGRDECAAKVSMMKVELDEVHSKMAILSEQHQLEVSKVRQEQCHLQKDLSQALGELASLREHHKVALEELQEEGQRLRVAMAQEWSTERSNLQDEIRDLQSALEGAGRKVCELDSQLAEERAHCSSLVEASTSSVTEKERVFAEKVVSMQEEIDNLRSTVEGKQAELVELRSLLEEERESKDAALQEVGEQLARAREAYQESELRLASSEQQRESREAELRQQLIDMKASISDQAKNIERQFTEKIATLERDLLDTKKLLSEKTKALHELAHSGGVKEEEWHRTMDLLSQQVDRLTVEVKEQYSYVTQLRETLAEQVAEKEMIQAELDDLRLAARAGGDESKQDEIDCLKQRMADREAEFHEELRKKQSMLHTMELSLNAKEDLLSESCDSVFSLRSQVEELQGRLTPEPLENDSTDGPGQSVSAEVRRLSVELQRERRRSVDLQVQVVELKEVREKEQEGNASQVTQVKTEGEESTGEVVTELQKKLSASEATISELSCDLESFKTALLEREDGYEERLQGYREKVAELDEYVEHLRSQMQATGVQVEEMNEHNLVLEEENQSLHEALERLQDSHLALKEESEGLAQERDLEISQLREELSMAEFSLAEGSLYSPKDVEQLEEEVGRLQKQLKAERARGVQRQRGSRSRTMVIKEEGEDVGESVDSGHMSASDAKLEQMRVEHERALRDLQEQVTQLKGELQQLHATLNRKSANLDDSVGYIDRLSQQLQLAELEKEQFRTGLVRQHQEEVDRLVRGHCEEMNRTTQEMKQLDDLRQQHETLILQLMEQTTALDEDKTRLSKIVRELREEREGHLKLVEELAIKACQ